jgi:hypothetical protein
MMNSCEDHAKANKILSIRLTRTECHNRKIVCILMLFGHLDSKTQTFQSLSGFMWVLSQTSHFLC